MIACVTTVAFRGLEAIPVDVQVMISSGKIGMAIVGLADKAIAESRERVQAALYACGLSMPNKRVTINLAPADLPKEGSHYDLPIAIGLMLAMGVLPSEIVKNYLILGELSLDGSITAVNGVLPTAMTALSLDKGLICPRQCGPEAAWVNADMDILAPDTLLTIINHFKGIQIQKRPQPRQYTIQTELPDLCEIKGQKTAKRALEVCAAGRHNLLFVGPPGAGKSMLAQCLPSILPPLDSRELLDVSLIASIAGETAYNTLSLHCPFRAPHHSASMAAMIGGGLKGRPGEVSLAHNGILFLDEFPEFAPQVLDSLRQPLESGECIIARVNHHISYPARIQLIAAMNPCRCGMAGEKGYVCAKGTRCQTDYQARISGPLLDRIDLRIDVPALTAMDLMQPEQSEKSCNVAKRVARARAIQAKRFAKMDLAHIRTNGDCPAKIIEQIATPDQNAAVLLRDVSEKMRLSARAYHRILKVARTIADLDEAQKLSRHHLAEAISYRLGNERLVALN
ncbi:Mg chelatase-like protein [Bartonella bacilliformis str. Heidi Mejia]|uniref:Mg chelatase homolog n=2 Tax=Bartonella bacilliformis TaxID=774 RepID=A1UUD9_BARBK|nr:YifB family Mg chelatase-like AAA ATPase [Bartonella bacilliformis]ABM45475.1 Mg chelatase homolog [Bartonella bacilliformis KC583]EKS42906.1 Mg chelatase-like protein [Bartonella bacilliformis INS]EYS88891.1 Mg chelatase-like protein [Bartonella bacilliformis San Pedro600-02]EYS90853.1 Mg chelatase-like protein [Bartonella bacilliformis str. Heidi Mejia]EYS95595.1 Mg chelatase-like protein [Bartonella bacilliformis Peru-18]